MKRLLITTLVLFASGCASTGLDSLDVTALPLMNEKEKEIPARVIPVWTDTVLHRGGKAVRGFGGRVIFYGAEENQPIEVDGALVVYAWDDTNGRGRETPDRKYVYKQEDLEKHYSPSKIGHSYSFWLPWDPVGGETKHVTLISRFVSTAGGEITSSAAHVVLPGPMEAEEEAVRPETRITSRTLDTMPQRDSEQAIIRQLGFEEVSDAEEPGEPVRRSNATTIDLPIHMARGGQNNETSYADSPPRSSLSVEDFEAAEVAELRSRLESQEQRASGERLPPVSRFGPRQLPVRSSQSGQRFSSRERTQHDRSMSRFGSTRTRRSNHVSVQQKIAKDAAEAKARREAEWGQYQSTSSDQD